MNCSAEVKLGESTLGLMLALFVVLIAMSWIYVHLFTGRAALLHMGAFTATIMAANVAMLIIPNQKIVVADAQGGPGSRREIRQGGQAAFAA